MAHGLARYTDLIHGSVRTMTRLMRLKIWWGDGKQLAKRRFLLAWKLCGAFESYNYSQLNRDELLLMLCATNIFI